LLTWFIAPLILKQVIHDPEISKTLSLFKNKDMGPSFFIYLSNAQCIMVGTNNSRYLVSGTLAETLANILFDVLLIFGKFGFPKMGLNALL